MDSGNIQRVQECCNTKTVRKRKKSPKSRLYGLDNIPFYGYLYKNITIIYNRNYGESI